MRDCWLPLSAGTWTIYLDQPPQQMVDVAKVVVEGVDAGLAMAKPGNTVEQVKAAWQVVLRRNGLRKDSRVSTAVQN